LRLYLVAYLYALASIKPHRLKLENGWTSANKRYGTGNPGYAVSGGVVYLSGSVIGGTVGDNITTLPKAVTPTHFIYRLIYDFEGNAGFIVITPTGELQVFGSQAAGFASLAGISYPVPGTKWHDFTLTNGWQSGNSKYHTGARPTRSSTASFTWTARCITQIPPPVASGPPRPVPPGPATWCSPRSAATTSPPARSP
jgi:hypothetical protein